MFKQDLSVPEDGPSTPSVNPFDNLGGSTPYGGVRDNTPAMTPAAIPGPENETPAMTPAMTPGMTPGMTPAMTPATAGMTPGMTPATVMQDGGKETEGAEEEEEGAENEDDAIRRLTMQNPFTPANAFAQGGPGINWSELAAYSPAPVPSTVVGVAPAFNDTIPTSPSLKEPQDIKERIAILKQQTGASTPIVHNVVATANLMVELDLKKIALTARNAEYNPRRFAAVIMRIREPKSTALVFKTGKLVVTGTKSAEEARHAARKFGRVIMKVGYPDARFKDFKVENLVSTFTVPFPVHLEQLYKKLGNSPSQYEPEVFPGLIYKTETGTLLIFVSGKCVMIGMKTQDDIDRAFCDVLPRLYDNRKK